MHEILLATERHPGHIILAALYSEMLSLPEHQHLSTWGSAPSCLASLQRRLWQSLEAAEVLIADYNHSDSLARHSGQKRWWSVTVIAAH